MKHRRLTGRITAAALSAVMGCSGAFLYSAPPAYAAGYERVNGYYQMLDGTVIDGVDYTVDANGVCTKVEEPADGTQDGQNGAEGNGQSGQSSQNEPAVNGQNTGSATQESPADSGQTDSKKEIGPGIK